MTTRFLAFVLVVAAALPAAAQVPPSDRPVGRISVYSNVMSIQPDGSPSVVSGDVVTAIQLEVPDGDNSHIEYGLDVRRTSPVAGTRPPRLSLYDGYAGARFAGGLARVRVGQLWIADLGGLGSVSGGLFELRQPRSLTGGVRLRVGGFAGVEPDPYGLGHAAGVRKAGVYAIAEASGGRRHTVGYVRIKQGSLVERSVITGSNFLRAGSRVFVYQTAEYDLAGPAGQGRGGLSYLLVNAHASAADRVDVQGLYHRGRSLDARSIADDVLNGRPLRPGALDGLLFASAGGRVTVRVRRNVRVNAGYTRDRNNRDSATTGRLSAGASVSNLGSAGIDLTVQESRTRRPTGEYNSHYLSVGRQFGGLLYLSAEYSSSVSVVRFTRGDGFTLETRPHTRQVGATSIVTLNRYVSLLVTAERTRDDAATDLRVLSGLTIRLR